MSVTEAEIQWFIARDGKQHGPVSDVEMRKLVELGHLRSTDLLWRLGFPDWRPAPAVFSPPASFQRPAAQLQAYSPGSAPLQPAQAPSPQIQPARAPTAAQQPAQSIAPRFEPISTPAVGPAPHANPTLSMPGGLGLSAAGTPAVASAAAPGAFGGMPGRSQPTGGAFGGGMGPQPGFLARPPEATPGPGGSPGSLTALRGDMPSGGRRAGAPHADGHHHGKPGHPGPQGHHASAGHGAARADQTRPGDVPSRRRGWLRQVAIAAMLVGILGGGGWLAYKNLDTIKALVSTLGSTRSGTSATGSTESPPAAEANAPGAAPAAVAISVEDLDAKLTKMQHWTLIREQFGEWYQARIKEASRLSSTNKTEVEVAGYLAQGLVELRRSHADKALAASSATLQTMANAFSANVSKLGQESTNACMAFILKGEASPPVVEIIENPAKNAEINAHFAAIFTAVGEGMKSPAQHSDPTEADYQLLVAQLTKLGWAAGDLQLFADPRGPSKTSPDRYCKMMHEFFVAHLAVEDPAARDRLLYRTLKLVVAG